MRIITKAIIELHDKIIKKSGGHTGIINIGNLDFSISQANATSNLVKKLANLLFGIISRHPFVDGNKRTALVLVETILRINGKTLISKEKDIWITLNKISTGQMNTKQIAEWISRNIR